MKLILTPIVVDTIGTVTKNLEKRLSELEMEGEIEIIQTTALLKSTEIPRKVQWKTIN